MPTADRPQFVVRAVACFLAQDFASRELVVLDNGRTPIAALLPDDPRIRCFSAGPGSKLGALRYRACELARGEIILHWDDDDWYPPNRISRQVETLTRTGADLCGSSRIYFLHESAQQAWVYASRGSRPWIAGSTLAYRRSLWERRPFDAVQVGEDSLFVAAMPREKVADLADPGLCIAAVHACNTSAKRPMGLEWQPVDAAPLLQLSQSGPAAASVPAAPPSDHFLRGRRVCIGIHVRGDTTGLPATLRHLADHTPLSVRRLVLADGGADAVRSALLPLGELTLSASELALGAAACFNRLLRDNEADVFVFLESGSLVGPGWLRELLAALDADPRNGLAGPSTNRSWNRQGSLALEFGHASLVDAQAHALRTRFAGQWQNLAPLHCLADFCYAVRREVVVAIGGADEAYGLGPCWEMDYSARAARAGYSAVWAQGAYVYRPPALPQRQREETANFAASRERYQRKLCGQLLSGARHSIKPHCRGDDCPNFAPAQAIELQWPLRPQAGQRAVPRAVQAPAPLVSCIMPTHGRLGWVLQAIHYFQRQDYPRRELLIIDDGPQSAAMQLPRDAAIRYVHRGERMSIGAKRNLACELAQGEHVAHWDDDDWYGVSRLSAQLAPLIAGSADITALNATPFMDLARWQFWHCTPALFARMFVHAVHGGTLVYTRRLFGGGSRFPNVSLAEDAAFLRNAVLRGARLQAIAAEGHFVYVRHGRNAWQFCCGSAFDAQGWREVGVPAELAEDLPFYRLQGDATQHTA